MASVCDSDGEFGSGGTLGAKLAVDEELWIDGVGPVPVGEVGVVPFGVPGLLRKRPLLEEQLLVLWFTNMC